MFLRVLRPLSSRRRRSRRRRVRQCAASRVQVGTLSCSVSAGIGLIVGSQRNVNCNFQPDDGAGGSLYRHDDNNRSRCRFYHRQRDRLGRVRGTSRYVGMLTGTYAGATAQATVIAGVGANALVGGSNRSVALQPLSVQGQVGLNAAAGIGALELHLAQ